MPPGTVVVVVAVIGCIAAIAHGTFDIAWERLHASRTTTSPLALEYLAGESGVLTLRCWWASLRGPWRDAGGTTARLFVTGSAARNPSTTVFDSTARAIVLRARRLRSSRWRPATRARP